MARRLIIGLCLLLLLAAAGAAAGGYWLVRWLDAPGPGVEATVVEVPTGASLARVSAVLAQRGVIDHPGLFQWYGRLSGQAARLRAGEYEIPAGATPRSVLDQLVAGEVVLHSVTFIEGWTFEEMRAAIAAHEAIGPKDAALSGEAVMAELGMPGSLPEGWFLPETYRFPRGTPGMQVMRMAHEAMKRTLDEAWAARAPDLPLASAYEVLILASIVEKETGLDAERPAIAGVFARRLKRGMRLQTDPTVIYGLGKDFDGDLRRRDLERDTPYNTYTRAGLPPTPIALPGRASVMAAAAPADGDALFFVATGDPDGGHYFSVTLEEHNEAVRRYLRKLRERRQQR
jgi:UPF0755 protein